MTVNWRRCCGSSGEFVPTESSSTPWTGQGPRSGSALHHQKTWNGFGACLRRQRMKAVEPVRYELSGGSTMTSGMV